MIAQLRLNHSNQHAATSRIRARNRKGRGMKSGRHQSPPSRTGDCANSNVSTKGNLKFAKAAPPNAGASPAPILSFERQLIARSWNRLKICSNEDARS